MTRGRQWSLAIAIVFLPIFALAACATGDPEMNDSLTWQEAKRSAQQTEDEIVALITPDQVASVEQRAEGTLLSCNGTEHQWSGRTTVTLAPGADVEALVRTISEHYRETGTLLTPEEYDDINGDLTVQLVAADRKENYLVGTGVQNPEQLEVSSFSACFTLPDDVYPGGVF